MHHIRDGERLQQSDQGSMVQVGTIGSPDDCAEFENIGSHMSIVQNEPSSSHEMPEVPQ